ncbi:MAG: DUF3616 domain-containing protein [Synechococcales cyanobacterium M58_A2018_015]|nr:DUF3616 domain-containing protein [Synechococcales cyanobacterium M58_A2018_015]
MPDAFLLSRVLLQFQGGTDAHLHNLSAAAFTPDGNLWLGADEMTLQGGEEVNTIERLSPLQPGVYGNHHAFALREFLDLEDSVGEIDIEGLDVVDSYLWLTGSHSSKRKKPKGKEVTKDIQRLATVETDGNRYWIARIPIVEGQLYRTCSDPHDPSRILTAACLRRTLLGNELTEALQDDPHLGPYFASSLPSKENGFDIEGLAVHGNRLFLGLRGPVLRGWAMLLELELADADAGELKLQAIGEQGRRYKKYFLNLDGLGVRELCFQDEDLLILAGPTMDLAGSLRVYRLQGAMQYGSDAICAQETGELDLVFDLPFSREGDKAEGMALFSCLGEPALFIAYDSPAAQRRVSDTSILMDAFRLT